MHRRSRWTARRTDDTLITLLTDFGTADGYVGEMKGVLASLAPHAAVVDIAHDVAPHDVEGARLALARYWRRFPEGTVHSSSSIRESAAHAPRWPLESEGRFFVGPDNGVLSPALLHGDARCVSIADSRAAPRRPFMAATCSRPRPRSSRRVRRSNRSARSRSDPVIRRTPEATRRDDGAVQGEVITVDRFGNAVTNLLAMRGGQVQVAGLDARRCGARTRTRRWASRSRSWARAGWWRSQCGMGVLLRYWG